ncbi:WD repeat-containing protein 26 homolog [Juglans microcarpa x Juglans regia]|uniref:WD repeat-containing protein 26 homolog n=1 Tax=Juglans microcarpa x Juglans regia TaxID=2249226 RepID=UPI001B7EC672|nr:WD repeat-containing protein 26 homolog [Juglans microcarpa x Juglans regia]XP_041006950.1 WD repeat-containing protein 26 homolog [Juglans microcarpa x Juglans regia]XP_041006951.1 WD repeat-containing protein 26 homolog [Juglans microcarpa x Juglans regia]XP_041006952.1 WD repeat-containing protein 26 homolog [Juglans microcarpa x Juglans regia]XP_041006953.1 WD repeat-containing protein 26 homolog [Juglans microcarpa x Juglans regia]XP_041006954.1 WD repeat-containing protein 26 homolog 
MGGVEDEEPATKRTKVSFEELRGLSNGSSFIEPVSASSSDLMARPLASEGDKEVVGSKGIIKRVEFVRIIANALYSLGYKKSGAHLEEESGIPLHSSVINVFMQQILDGNWDESVSTLLKIGLSDERIVLSASLLILEQKFFELLDAEKVMDALKTLRTEIAPLCINKRVRELSSCIVAPSQCNLVGSCSQDIVRSKSRSKLLLELQKLLPPTVMIPEDRLEHLVEQALLLQRDACIFHNSLDYEVSLYTDHLCGRDQIPSQTLQILQEHRDEVWFLQFSHNGKYLASSSNDRSAIIWEVDVNGGVSLKHRLCGHQKPVCAASWSPDDHELLTCGLEEVIRRWDVSSGECLHVYEKADSGLVSCGWFPDGKWIFSGVNDKSICLWQLDGRELQCWKGQRTLRISDLEITNDGKQIISICRENVILLHNREANTERLIEEDQTVTSFSLSRDNRFLLVNLLDQEIHLWNIDGDLKLVAKYKGHKRARFVIRSCFGGLAQAFIASGSEDSQVYIWHRGSGELIEALPGHSGAVNCVSWNPVNPHMLASASDDHTIRIWGLNDLRMKRKDTHSNSVHYCNGGPERSLKGSHWL